MNIITGLKINLLYENDNYTTRFDLSVANKVAYNPDDLYESTFIDAMGGIEFTCNDHFIFFQSCDYHDLFPCVTFLLNSLFSLQVIDESIYEDHDNFLGTAVISQLINTNGSMLIIEEVQNHLEISYRNVEQLKNHGRNNFYFEKLIVPRSVWIDAAIIALNEYFMIVNKVLTKFPSENRDSYLRKLAANWDKFSERADL